MKAVAVSSVKVADLIEDENNPNKMSDKEIAALVASIKRFGFVVPVITNKDLLIADGHQRLKAARIVGLEEVPVVRLDVKEVDRVMIQQVMNKLKGKHSYEMDEKIYAFLLEEGKMGELAELLALEDQKLADMFPQELDLPDGSKEPIQKVTFTLSDPQVTYIFEQLKKVHVLEENTLGNNNDNGNRLYEIVVEWAKQKEFK